MSEYAFPTLYALFVWWFSTGAIIYLDGLPQRTFRWSMLGATLVLAISIYGLWTTSSDTTVTGAYLAFTYGLLVWGWQEISFHMGYVTGPRKESCPQHCRGWRHFGHAIQTILYHELAIIASAAVVVWVTWDGANQVGMWTFMVLWGMRQSAKLNVFLGVRNLNEEFLPEHLEYLKGFLTKKPMNLLFPVSVTISTVIAVILFQKAFATGVSDFEAAGFTFLGVLMVLAILEHWFLVLPLPAAALWNWYLKSRGATKPFEVEHGHDQGAAPVHDALDLQSWSAHLNGPCNPQELSELLDAVARGAYGEVERVKGIAQSSTGWVHFDVAGGRSSIAAFAPGAGEEPRVIAIGRKLDEMKLRTAFQACVAPAAV